MELVNLGKLKYKVHKTKREFDKHLYNFQYWILNKVIDDDVIEEYAIDTEMLHDYYNEEPEYDRWDRD